MFDIIYGNTVGTTTPRPDWEQTNEKKADYIRNKPDLYVKTEIDEIVHEINTKHDGKGNFAEIFNDYENNAAEGNYSHAEGFGNIAGAKCFKLDATHEYSESDYNVDENTGKYYITTSPELITQELIDAGLEYSIYLTGNYNLQGKVISVGDNYIEVTNYNIPNSWEMNNLHSGSYIFFPTVPHLGDEPCGTGAHVEGYANFAVAVGSHAEGYNNKAVGKYSHAEGRDNIAGHCDHVEGIGNKILSDFSHMEGSLNSAPGSSRYSHTEGYKKISFGQGSHAEGGSTNHVTGLRDGSATFDELFLWENATDTEHVEKIKEIVVPRWRESKDFGAAGGAYSHAEGLDSFAVDVATHSEGTKTIAGADSAHSEGRFTQALGANSHVEGYQNTVIGTGSHGEGGSANRMSDSLLTASPETIANNWKSKKNYSVVAGSYSHGEGNNTAVTGYAAHAEGQETLASGVGAHSEGRSTIAAGIASHAEGYNTIANGEYQHVSGRWNKPDKTSLFIIGNGGSEAGRSNALVVDTHGNAKFSGKVEPVDYSNFDDIYITKEEFETAIAYCGEIIGDGNIPDNVELGDIYTTIEVSSIDGYLYTGTASELLKIDTRANYLGGDDQSLIVYGIRFVPPHNCIHAWDIMGHGTEEMIMLYDFDGKQVGETYINDPLGYPNVIRLSKLGISSPDDKVTFFIAGYDGEYPSMLRVTKTNSCLCVNGEKDIIELPTISKTQEMMQERVESMFEISDVKIITFGDGYTYAAEYTPSEGTVYTEVVILTSQDEGFVNTPINVCVLMGDDLNEGSIIFTKPHYVESSKIIEVRYRIIEHKLY